VWENLKMFADVSLNLTQILLTTAQCEPGYFKLFVNMMLYTNGDLKQLALLTLGGFTIQFLSSGLA
jgi:hypothetical protein